MGWCFFGAPILRLIVCCTRGSILGSPYVRALQLPNPTVRTFLESYDDFTILVGIGVTKSLTIQVTWKLTPIFSSIEAKSGNQTQNTRKVPEREIKEHGIARGLQNDLPLMSRGRSD